MTVALSKNSVFWIFLAPSCTRLLRTHGYSFARVVLCPRWAPCSQTKDVRSSLTTVGRRAQIDGQIDIKNRKPMDSIHPSMARLNTCETIAFSKFKNMVQDGSRTFTKLEREKLGYKYWSKFYGFMYWNCQKDHSPRVTAFMSQRERPH